ncbi:MAG: glycosyltransferase [Candidatus Omnitrophica bacterium]|nr:glycosyltransferase [Candidatus Omnitrophota bacterium]
MVGVISKNCYDTNPIFSIVIPTYNRREQLKECLASLFSQIPGRGLFEIIVIEDGSDCVLCEDKDFGSDTGKIRYITTRHQGPAAARNLGIKEARGEIVIFLDDDVIAASGWAKSVIESWKSYPGIDGIGGYIVSDPKDTICARVSCVFFNWFLDKAVTKADYACFMSTCNAGYTKKALIRVNGFDEQFRGAYGEDRDLNARILQSGGKMRLTKDMIVYHDRYLSFSRFLTRNFNYGKASFHIYNKHPKFARSQFCSYLYLSNSMFYAFEKHREKILACLLLAVSQIATLCGYFVASFTWRRGNSR